jgi:hypothetical protein
MDPKDFAKHAGEDFPEAFDVWNWIDFNEYEKDRLKAFENLSLEEKLFLIYLKVIRMERELSD